MRIYISHVGAVSYLVPLVAAIARRQSLSVPLRLLGAYAAAALAESLYMMYLGASGVRNLWVTHLFTPLEATLFLWMFARWQLRESARMALLICIPVYLAVWGILHLTVESVAHFPVYSKPVECMLLVGVGAYTLISRSQNLLTPVTRHSWFWASVGTVLYFSFVTVLNPIAHLLEGRNDLLIIAFEMNATMGIFANLLFAWAMLCQNPPLPSSGGSSSPPPSSAAFSRPHSSPRC